MKTQFVKFVVITLSINYLFLTDLQAQKPNYFMDRLHNASVSTGETPFGGNVAVSAFFIRDKFSLALDYKDHIYCATPSYSALKSVSIGFSIGALKNTPWFGPQITTNFLNGHFRTLHWLGACAGNSSKGSTGNLDFCFSYQKATFSAGGLSIYYALKHVKDQEESKIITSHVYAIKETLKLTPEFDIYFEQGYIFDKGLFEKGRVLWSAGLKYVPNK